MMNLQTVALFGVFDGIHEGHMMFIREAKTHGDHVVAIVARDSVVEILKGKAPRHNEATRIKMLLEVPEIDLVFLGDEEEGIYKTLKEINPEIAFLGYDQQALYESINLAIKNGLLPEIKLIYGKAHMPETFHSSIIKNETRD